MTIRAIGSFESDRRDSLLAEVGSARRQGCGDTFARSEGQVCLGCPAGFCGDCVKDLADGFCIGCPDEIEAD